MCVMYCEFKFLFHTIRVNGMSCVDPFSLVSLTKVYWSFTVVALFCAAGMCNQRPSSDTCRSE